VGVGRFRDPTCPDPPAFSCPLQTTATITPATGKIGGSGGNHWGSGRPWVRLPRM